MTGFEAYDVRAWLDGALVVLGQHVSKTVAKVNRRILVAGSMAVAVAGTAVAAPSPTSIAQPSAVATPFSLPGKPTLDGDSVPDHYWSKLLTSMKEWQPIANEVGGIDDLPDPLS